MDPVTLEHRHSSHAPELGNPDSSAHSSPDTAPQANESLIVEIFKFCVLALIIVIPFRMYVAQPFIVNGASMAPTFETGEYLIVDRATYHLDQPHRGDVVVFRYPIDPSKFFIKRIIGLPGETVELANGVTTIIGDDNVRTVLNEAYLKKDPTDDHITIELSSEEYFVMGDNRGASSDSREWGPVPRDSIVGRAFIRLFPVSHFGVLPGTYSHESIPSTHSNY
jgi:signal peptidase I